ncbi:MmcQ/YjbR family DNA-binding protein [Streptosporangium longisporum]|uniref:DGTPase n=1 Tax=Streptosporangium longisporum TaxID=46187 RepID=A0ABP6KGH3_9ACTN
MDGWREVRETLREFALRLPECYEDHPWGDTVVKVNKKIFLFLGVEEPTEKWRPSVGVKLPESNGHALALPGARPSGYGLGRTGWVTIPLTGPLPETEVLLDWVEESYRAVAPKRLVARLDTS